MQAGKRAPPLAGKDSPPPPSWDDWDVFAMRETLLVETMAAAVDGRSATSTRAKAWAWIEANDEHPFSFRVCALAMGADPEQLRAMFRDTAVRLGLIAS
ncbi:hypothetical protein [Azospirillum sp. SYSU D00513]|uniref:hypothetical protein n=1 Tax=Azospirillum sp. SYSU D00513 TaxID=2812561 RepID=UPI001A973848|nr:hypothetical protein [Azospirillum sp. SYSU D00513]